VRRTLDAASQVIGRDRFYASALRTALVKFRQGACPRFVVAGDPPIRDLSVWVFPSEQRVGYSNLCSLGLTMTQ
jgi:hypothetical protein